MVSKIDGQSKQKKKEKSLVFPSNHHLSTNYLLFHMGSDT